MATIHGKMCEEWWETLAKAVSSRKCPCEETEEETRLLGCSIRATEVMRDSSASKNVFNTVWS